MEFGWSSEAGLRTRLRASSTPSYPSSGRPDSGEEVAPTSPWGSAGPRRQACSAPHWPSEYGGRDGVAPGSSSSSARNCGARGSAGSQYMNVNWIGPAIIAAAPTTADYHLTRIAAGRHVVPGISRTRGRRSGRMQTGVRDGDDYVDERREGGLLRPVASLLPARATDPDPKAVAGSRSSRADTPAASTIDRFRACSTSTSSTADLHRQCGTRRAAGSVRERGWQVSGRARRTNGRGAALSPGGAVAERSPGWPTRRVWSETGSEPGWRGSNGVRGGRESSSTRRSTPA